MENKKGLSTIVITLILILLSLVAITAISILVKGIIDKNTETIRIQNQFFGENIDLVSVNSYSPFVNITISRQTGEIKATEINKTTTTTESSVAVDILSVVDLSGSMIICNNITEHSCNDLGGSYFGNCNSLPSSAQSECVSEGGSWMDKLTPLKEANKQMMDDLLVTGENRLGLSGYRDHVISSASIDPTNNISLLTSVINSWTAVEATCICCSINDAVTRLSTPSSQGKAKAIIVMSDGEANIRCSAQGTGDARQDAIHAACDANNSLTNLTIWSIGVGDVDTDTLTDIAECGGGKYFSVLNTSELIQIYKTIAEEIEIMYQSEDSLSYLAIVFYNSTDSYKEVIYSMPEILQTKTYNFNLQGVLSGKITKIEIYPVIVDKSGKEVTGPMLSSWKAD